MSPSPDLLLIRRAASQDISTAGLWITDDERFLITRPKAPYQRIFLKQNGSPVSKWWITSLHRDGKVFSLLETTGIRDARFSTRDDALKALCLVLEKDGYKVVS